LGRIESLVILIILDATLKRVNLDLDFRPKVEAVPGAVYKRRNRPPFYRLTLLLLTPKRVYISAYESPIIIGYKATPLLRYYK
jgi:hypothetical protein